ncbi:LOW QUALITY PROTEIN: gap junction delta-3 protein-like [Erpetoichthys calabaricus]|uniref:LOW QUALITY PROTEIN: gap junction delta-3 protein-like n=1 Tax=Erpetoichthys calabaricus TaxID=27687 RepID=UPI00109FBAE0|nr:LOW QUALITY PROTEIN: gap junction delta-3 protein-like [Erpetoichthys calabaricus]
MAEWNFLQELFRSLHNDMTALGRLWLLHVMVFRLLLVGTVTPSLFENEYAEFTCNTQMTGCREVCFNRATTISHYRFCVFHVVLLSTPVILFVTYALTKSAVQHGAEVEALAGQETQRSRRRLVYLINVIVRLLVEVGFLVGQWYLYDFRVKSIYICTAHPCPHNVDCFLARSYEKTAFLCFYFGVGVFSSVISFLEVLYIIRKWKASGREQVGHNQSTLTHSTPGADELLTMESQTKTPQDQ